MIMMNMIKFYYVNIMILMNMSNVYFMKLMIMMKTTICFKNKHDDYNGNYPFIV